MIITRWESRLSKIDNKLKEMIDNISDHCGITDDEALQILRDNEYKVAII